MFIIIEWHLLQSDDAPKLVYLFGLALFVMTAWRFIMIAQFESWYARGPARWREIFIFSGLMHAAIWSVYIVYRLITMPEEPMMLLGILYTSAIAAGGTFVYSLYDKTVRIYLAVLLGPLAIFYLAFQSGPVNLAVGIGVIVTYFYLVGTGARMAELVWSFLSSNHEYKLRLSAFEQAQEASTVQNKTNRRFIRQLLHRVKNPLNGLLGVIGMISVDDNDVENQGMLNIAKRSGYSMLDLITDLEAFIEQRDQSSVPESTVFNLRKTLENALAEMGVKAHEKGRELSYLYQPDVPERIEADPQWISNAFRRMLDFTIDMADQGEITVKIGAQSSHQNELLILNFYFLNSDFDQHDLLAAIERQLDVLPEDEDVADQLTLMVATAQFKALGAQLSTSSKDDLHKISVELPITSTSQQASSFKPAKYMAGKSILLIDLSPQNERSLLAEFTSWNMEVAVWTLDELMQIDTDIETDYVFINVPVDDKKAISQIERINILVARFGGKSHYVLYASELQRKLLDQLTTNFIFVEKPVARDQLLEALREVDEVPVEVPEIAQYRCENSKVLVAEDNLLNQKVVLKLLEQVGVQVDTCVNGEEAVELFEKGQYSFVLMDYQMPRMSGLEATKAIRLLEKEADQHVPIVVMTSEQSAEIERECLTAGVDDFLITPLQYEDLVQVMQRWLG
ncbi:ATP-binding response regulator [Reinekea marinisedimentorum]|nr:response regulator [Reinekea marinisedimentorum]